MGIRSTTAPIGKPLVEALLMEVGAILGSITGESVCVCGLWLMMAI